MAQTSLENEGLQGIHQKDKSALRVVQTQGSPHSATVQKTTAEGLDRQAASIVKPSTSV